MRNWLLRLGLIFFKKLKFKTWTQLEDKKFNIIKAVEDDDDDFSLFISHYISTALYIYPKDYSKVYWKDSVEAFVRIHNVTIPTRVLPLVSKETEKKGQKDEWDYPGRLWFFYSSRIADAFGWNDRQIANLPVDDALAYIQEILTEKQLEREFVWSTAEVAYKYDKATKYSHLQKLSRPYWMLPDFDKKPEVKKIKIPKALLPVGTIIKMNPNEAKETQSTTDS